MQYLQEIREILHDRLERSGTAFYSSSATLKKGKYLIVGLNPGGDVNQTHATIGESLSNFLDANYNAYYEDDWGNNRLQRNLKKLFEHLGTDLRDVCATNLIYERSRGESTASFSDIAMYKCILDKVINVVMPKFIITFGQKPYNALCELLDASEISHFKSGHKNWRIKLSERNHGGQIVKLLGLPHLSRYVLYTREEQLNWIKSQICTA